MLHNFDWEAIAIGAPYITLSRLGIAISPAEIKALGVPEKVIIGYDKKANVIGVKPYDGEKGIPVYDFARKIRNKWVRIGCKHFIASLDIPHTKKFMAKMVDGVLTVKIT